DHIGRAGFAPHIKRDRFDKRILLDVNRDARGVARIRRERHDADGCYEPGPIEEDDVTHRSSMARPNADALDQPDNRQLPELLAVVVLVEGVDPPYSSARCREVRFLARL